MFHPKQPSNVLVTENFVAPAQEIPSALTQMLQASKEMEKQAGGFADVIEARSQYGEGLMNEMQGNHDAALTFFLKAVDTLDRDRRALRDERSRGTWVRSSVNSA